MYLLDTCVISETRAKKPDAAVIEWLSRQTPETLYLSTISIGEIKNGICLLGEIKKARALAAWLSELEATFSPRILSVNATVAECWGEILAESARAGKTRPSGRLSSRKRNRFLRFAAGLWLANEPAKCYTF